MNKIVWCILCLIYYAKGISVTNIILYIDIPLTSEWQKAII